MIYGGKNNSTATPPTKNEFSTSDTEILACLDGCISERERYGEKLHDHLMDCANYSKLNFRFLKCDVPHAAAFSPDVRKQTRSFTRRSLGSACTSGEGEESFRINHLHGRLRR